MGSFAEYCYITPGTCVIRVPDELTDEGVAPENCALSTVIAGWEAIDIQPFEDVLIQGRVRSDFMRRRWRGITVAAAS
jgi:D-arabinose 1-dehydrogenase-like Zn-dependent alcohol dehydrogenase